MIHTNLLIFQRSCICRAQSKDIEDNEIFRTDRLLGDKGIFVPQVERLSAFTIPNSLVNRAVIVVVRLR